jgi:hypothetical protein
MQSKKILVYTFLTLAISSALLSACNKEVEDSDDVAGRPQLTDEQKQEIKTTAQSYELSDISGKYNANDGVTDVSMTLFAASETGTAAKTVYGIWYAKDGSMAGTIEGKLGSNSKLVGKYLIPNGQYGRIMFSFAKDSTGVMAFTGTWGTGASFTNGGKWIGAMTENSVLVQNEIKELKTQYAEFVTNATNTESTTEPTTEPTETQDQNS